MPLNGIMLNGGTFQGIYSEKKTRQPQTGRPWVPCCPIRRGTDLHSFELLGTLKFSNAKSSLLVDSLAAQLME